MSTPITTSHAASFSRVADANQIPAAAVDGLLEGLPVGVMVVDRDGRLVYMNEAARALKIERLESLQWAIVRALLTEETAREEEMEVAVMGEQRRWLSACVTPVRVAGVGVNAAFVVLSDVTAQKRMAAWTPTIEMLVNL